jgi:hypothetical protein
MFVLAFLGFPSSLTPEPTPFPSAPAPSVLPASGAPGASSGN